MAKVSKTKKNSQENKEKVQKVDERKSPKAKRGRPAKTNVKKSTMKAKSVAVAKVDAPAKAPKAKPKHPSTATMVTAAFANLKDRKGLTLAAIRNYVGNNYECVLDKRNQNNIKKFISEAVLDGRIKMMNHDGNEVNFSKRFALVK